ncbi:MAG: FRG domain-containing protein [Clostridia bacterium]|nr:FRG domain-containing protein [Clostridia bacterium]
MIKVVHIDNVNDLFSILLTEQKFQDNINRYRGEFLYRGIPDESFKLETTLKRNCKHLQKDLEMPILRNFMKYAAIEDPAIERSVWRQMILGAHHGLPTRMLDWSQSPLISLHFSLTEDNLEHMDAHNCVIWKIDVNELHSLLPETFKNTLAVTKSKYFSVDSLSKVAPDLSSFDRDIGDSGIAIIEPPSIDPRIVNQYSFFSIIPTELNDIEDFFDKNTSNTVKYVIDKNIRWQTRDLLDQQNISERIVYPGLDGLSKWLGRHYYVK